MCDELHDTSTISEGCWAGLAEHFDADQILEVIYTAGMYHAVSFLANGLCLPVEPFAERFPS